MKIIGLTGSMGSGKSTIVKIIEDLTHEKVSLVKLAQPLYDIQEFVYNRVKLAYKRPESFVKDRKLLQWLGTDWGRSLDKDLWTKIWAEEVKFIRENYPHMIIVCDDIRFDNEADLVKELGGCVIKVQTDKNLDRITTNTGIAGHKSEQGVDLNKVDYVIENNGTIDDLRNSVLTINAKLALW